MRPLSNVEIIRAIQSFKPLKAPRRFHPVLLLKYWHSTQDIVIRLCKDVFSTSTLPAYLNETNITVIPKVKSPKHITQYRPIGLCNTVYKTITKNHCPPYSPYLPSLINPSQSSFLPGRKAADNVIIVQEALHSFSEEKGSIEVMMLTLDLDKTFDWLEWSFIHSSLLHLNFPQPLIKLIMAYITTSFISILINGTSTTFFKPSCGICQGDPLSLYLLIICMESLSCSIKHAGCIKS